MHIDKDILELLALRTEFDARTLARMRKHLSSCEQCTNRLREIQDFYSAAEKEYADLKEREPIPPSTEVIASRRDMLLRVDFQLSTNLQGQPKSFVNRFYSSIRSRPFLSGMSGVVLVGVLSVGLNYLVQRNVSINPAYVSVNLERMSMDVYNEKDELIWYKPILVSHSAIESAMDSREELSQVTDIDNDGSKEVVTTYTLAKYTTDPLSSLVTIFNADGSIRRVRTLSSSRSYHGQQFDTTFHSQGVLVLPGHSEQETEIFVCSRNRRSPFALLRLDGRLNELGAYWHFGHLHGLHQMTDAGGRLVLLLMGVNDEAADRGLSRSVLVVLDPSKITEVGQSSATSGFGLPITHAEVFYIRFPDPDIVAALMAKSCVRRIEAISENSIHVIQDFESTAANYAGIEYIFEKNWMVHVVKPMSNFELIHRNLVSRGQVSSVLGVDYFKALAQGVTYWDGQSWVKHNTVVRVPRTLSRGTQ